jgi:hypothetical protein
LQDSSAKGFIIGNTISQTLASGVTISGEIVDYNDSSNVISLAHIGASDGNYHEFTTLQVTSLDSDGNTLRRTVTAINETLNDPGSENENFAIISEFFMDFSEVNPFGDLEAP